MENALSHLGEPAFKIPYLCGLRCPHLFRNTIIAVINLKPNNILHIWATNLGVPSSIAAWTRQSRNKLTDMYQEGACFVFLLQRTPHQFLPPRGETCNASA
jgi:TusA-related sulfurtransferase